MVFVLRDPALGLDPVGAYVVSVMKSVKEGELILQCHIDSREIILLKDREE